jgi:subtilisin family serine protease
MTDAKLQELPDWARELGLNDVPGAEAAYIVDNFTAAGGAGCIGVVAADHGIGFMYAEHQILVREPYADQVSRLLADNDFHAGEARPVVAGVMLVPVELGANAKAAAQTAFRVPNCRHDGQQPGVLRALELIDAKYGPGVAEPDYLITVADFSNPVVSPCPATEPEPAYYQAEPWPGICTENSGAGVRVFVADTGLLDGASTEFSWLADVVPSPADGWDPLPPTGAGAQPVIPSRYTGHGTFVAGVVRCVAPQADVIVSNAFKAAGSALESDLVIELDAALARGIDIFHLSISTHTRKSRPMLGIQAWLEVTRSYGGVVCVVAAGNDGSPHPSWPAAFADVVSVGALGTGWRNRASFSNYGSWVDVYAPGRDLVNAYTTGFYVCQIPPYAGQPRHFYGMAKWSGTSFSTPIVTGLIADRMRRRGENGRQAAAALLAEARAQAIPGVGAILLPCDGGRRGGSDRGCGCRCGCGGGSGGGCGGGCGAGCGCGGAGSR